MANDTDTEPSVEDIVLNVRSSAQMRTLGILWEEVDSACGIVRFRKFRMCTIETDQIIKAEQLIDRLTTGADRLCA